MNILTRSKTYVVVSDLHYTGAYGLMPPGFVASTGVTVPLNKQQRYLAKCWDKFEDALPSRYDYLIINGDAIEGQNPAEESRMLMEADPAFQAKAAAYGLSELARRARRGVLMSRGSSYHAGRGATFEEFLGELLSAIPIPGTQRRLWPWLRHEAWPDFLMDIAHKQSVTTRYRSMPLDREIGYALERAGREQGPAPGLIIRSHVHWGFGMWADGQIIAISTPPFKLQDDYVQTSISPNRTVPHEIGGLFIRVFEKPVDSWRVHVVRHLFAHPPMDVLAG